MKSQRPFIVRALHVMLVGAGIAAVLGPVHSKAHSGLTMTGSDALKDDTTGDDNTADGSFALRLNTTGTSNTAVGYEALFNCTEDNGETATGYQALFHDTKSPTGLSTESNGNVADGFQALYSNSTGGENVAGGYQALYSNTVGMYNTAYGCGALFYSTGDYNTAVGADALELLASGTNNIAIGSTAGTALGTLAATPPFGVICSNNIEIGSPGVAGDNNIIRIGNGETQTDTYLTGVIHGDGSGLTGVPIAAMAFTDINMPVTTSTGVGVLTIGGSPFLHAYGPNGLASDNTFAGNDAGNFTMGGSYDTGIGDGTLTQNQTGSDDSALGAGAMQLNTTGGDNVAIGASALAVNQTSSNNTACGFQALFLTSAGDNNTATGSVAMGGGAVTGGANTADGAGALQALTTGYSNVAAGYQSLTANTEGYRNTAAGTYSFQNMTSGNGNIGIGYYAGHNLVSGDNNIYIGNAGSSNESEVIRIGTNQTQTYISGTTVGINNSNPTTALDVGGEFMTIEGLGGVRCYMGDDGIGNDVQVGSLTSGVTAVSFFNATDSAFMHIECSSITIEGGSDLAEPFPISKAKKPVVEGDVVVIDDVHPGQLTLTDRPYDTRVAGVVSGANGIHPGIQMQQQGLLAGGKNVALSGRVYVQADASNGPIEPGDLLTTSGIPGRAMKVTDHARAQGAILGKAMTSLDDGQGMVLVLVTLQ